MDLFLTRQPIFDAAGTVIAYDLLFRKGIESTLYVPSASEAAANVISTSSWIMDLQQISEGRPVHVGVSREFLLQDYASLVPGETVRLEILDVVEPIPEVVEACRKLKESGFRLVVNAVDGQRPDNPLIPLADIVKVDFTRTDAGFRKRLAEKLNGAPIGRLAEGLDTQAALDEARKLGFDMFQGLFFAQPIIVSAKDIPGFKLNYVRILKEIFRDEIDFGRVEETLKLELSLAYKLLRLVNSAHFGMRQEITSIRQALVILGEEQFRKWIGLVALTGMGKDKPEELVVQALIRARACEQIAPLAGLADQSQELFLMGLFSHLDAILGLPMEDVLERIPLSGRVREALLGAEGPYRDLLNCVAAWESGEWETIESISRKLDIDEDRLPCLIGDAWIWCSKTFGAVRSAAA